MKNTCQTKIKSQKGASLILALILLLVCTTVGAAILTSVSASSGRLLNQAKSDARYYAVRSAADLLIDRIDGQSYILQREQVTVSTVTTKYNDTTKTYEYESGSAPGDGTSYSAYLNGTQLSAAIVDKSILKDSFLCFCYGEGVSPTSTNFSGAFPASGFSGASKRFSLIHDLGKTKNSGANNNLDVSIIETIESNGNLVFAIHSNEGGSDDYVIYVKFVAGYDDDLDSSYGHNSTEYTSSDDGVYQYATTTQQRLRTSTITWHYAGIE